MLDRSEIRAERSAGGAIRAIARGRSASRNAVRRAIRPGAPDTYYRASEIERFELAVHDVLVDYPLMAVADVAAIVDWRLSRRHLSSLVARLRSPLVGSPDVDAPEITAITAGELREVGMIEIGCPAW